MKNLNKYALSLLITVVGCSRQSSQSNLTDEDSRGVLSDQTATFPIESVQIVMIDEISGDTLEIGSNTSSAAINLFPTVRNGDKSAVYVRVKACFTLDAEKSNSSNYVEKWQDASLAMQLRIDGQTATILTDGYSAYTESYRDTLGQFAFALMQGSGSCVASVFGWQGRFGDSHAFNVVIRDSGSFMNVARTDDELFHFMLAIAEVNEYSKAKTFDKTSISLPQGIEELSFLSTPDGRGLSASIRDLSDEAQRVYGLARKSADSIKTITVQ